MSLTKVSYSMIQGDVLNILDYGAVGDGATDNTAAITAALTAANASGKSVFVPVGIYNIDSTISIPALQNVIIFGEGLAANQVTSEASYFRYTGATGNMFYFNNIAGVEFNNLWFGYNNNSYNGDLVRTNNSSGLDSTSLKFYRCLFAGEVPTNSVQAASLLRLEKTIISVVQECIFTKGITGITLYGYCNVITFKDNVFLQNRNENIYVATGSNESLTFENNTFEPTISGKCSGLYCANNQVIYNLIYSGNWHGDVGTAGGSGWLILGIVRGAVISGNTFFTPGDGASDCCIQIQNSSYGIQISGNVFTTGSANKAVSFNSACGAVTINSNIFDKTDTIVGLANISDASSIFSNVNVSGLPRNKAYLTTNQSIPNGTPTAISFAGNIYDQGSVHSTSVNPTRFTVPVGGAGLWNFFGSIAFATATGGLVVRIIKNGITLVASVSAPNSSTTTVQMQIATTDVAVDGDYYEVYALQSSGGALNVIGNAYDAVDTYFAAQKQFTGD